MLVPVGGRWPHRSQSVLSLPLCHLLGNCPLQGCCSQCAVSLLHGLCWVCSWPLQNGCKAVWPQPHLHPWAWELSFAFLLLPELNCWLQGHRCVASAVGQHACHLHILPVSWPSPFWPSRSHVLVSSIVPFAVSCYGLCCRALPFWDVSNYLLWGGTL